MIKESNTMTQRQTVAEEILSKLNTLSTIADELSSKADSKLSCISQPPGPLSPDTGVDTKHYPSYFNELRISIESIYNSVYRLRDLIDRVEL